MNLDPKKCKEMCIFFLTKDLDVLQLTVDDTYLEKVIVNKAVRSVLEYACQVWRAMYSHTSSSN